MASPLWACGQGQSLLRTQKGGYIHSSQSLGCPGGHWPMACLTCPE